MTSKKTYGSFVAGSLMLAAVVAYALTDVVIEVSSQGSSIVTSTGTFGVGSASIVGTCTDDGAGNFNFDFGDGSASMFSPIPIEGTGLTAQFIACNPMGGGSFNQVTFEASASLSLRVKLTGTLVADVGDNCQTACITIPLAGQYDEALTAPLSGTATVGPGEVFMNCNGQEVVINTTFGIPGDAIVTFATSVVSGSCQ